MYQREVDYVEYEEKGVLVSGQRVWIAWRGWMPHVFAARLIKHSKHFGTPPAQVLIWTRKGGERWYPTRDVFATKEEALGAL